MRNRFSLLSLSVASLLLMAGCAQEPTAPGSIGDFGSPSFGAAGKTVLVKGDLAGGPDASIPALACSPGSSPSTPVRLEGQLSHLGRSTVRVAACNTVTGFSFPTVFVSQVGKSTIEAANGDLIYADFSGPVRVNLNCSALTTIESVNVVTGGTGRFANGSGTLSFAGTQVPSACPASSDPPPLFVEGHVEGEVSTVGSNKQ